MTLTTQTPTAGSCLLSEGNGSISRENVSHAFSAGQILYNNSGTYEAYTGATGQKADAVAFGPGVVITRLAEVQATALIGLSDQAKTELATKTIFVR